MTLGQHFPPELLRQQLAPGRVLHLNCDFAGKEKFVVLGSLNPEALVLVINSRVHPYIAGKPDLARCQVSIDQASHDFLNRDSIVACHRAHAMGLHEVYRQIQSDPSRIKTMVSDNVREEIVSAVKHARTIPRQHQEQLLAALDDANE